MNIRANKFRKLGIAFAVFIMLVFAVANYVKYTYKDHLIRILQNYANKHLQTKVKIARKDISFHVLQTFPNVSVQLKNVFIESSNTYNKEDFQYDRGSDTLLFANRIFLEFDLLKMLRKEYEMKEFSIENGTFHILIDSEKNNNYTIWKKDTLEPATFSVELQKIKLSKINFSFIDKSEGLSFEAFINNHTLKGSIDALESELMSKGEGIIHSCKQNEKMLFTEKSFQYNLDILSNSEEIRILPGDIDLDGISLHIEGYLKRIPENYLSISLKTENSSLGGLINKLKKANFNIGKLYFTKGKISVNLKLEGYPGKDFPRIHAVFTMKNAHAGYSGRKTLKLNNIYINGSADVLKKTGYLTWNVQLDSVYAAQNKSYFHGNLHIVKNRNTLFNGNIHTEILLEDLHYFSDSLPFTGKEGKARLQLVLKNSRLNTKDEIQQILSQVYFSKLNIYNATVDFNNWLGQISNINGGVIYKDNIFYIDSLDFIRNSDDISFNGNIKVFDHKISLDKKQISIEGSLSASSIHFEHWTGNREETGKKSPGIYPDNLSLNIKSKIDAFYIKDHEYKNVSCEIIYHPLKWTLQDLIFQSLGGNCSGNAYFIYYPDDKLNFKAFANVSDMDIHHLFSEYKNFTQDVIIAENIKGRVSGEITLEWAMDTEFNISLPSINTHAELAIKDGELIGFEPLYRLSRFIDINELSHLKYKSFKSNITIENERVKLSHIDINSPDFSITGNGFHTFDNTYEYKIQPELSELLTKKAKQDKKVEFGNVVDDGLGKITIPIIISGTGEDIKIVYDKQYTMQRFRQRIREERENIRTLFSSSDEAASDSTGTSAEDTQQQSSGFTIEWDGDEDENDE